METLTKYQEKEVIKRMAKELLEEWLGIDATPRNIRRLAAHIIQFEKEVEEQAARKALRNYTK